MWEGACSHICLRRLWGSISIPPPQEALNVFVSSSLLLCSLLVLAGCSTTRNPQQPERSEAEVKAQIVRLLPAKVSDRNGWAQDIYTAFDTQKIYPSTENICAVLAVSEQESTYQVDPPVPNMGKIARMKSCGVPEKSTCRRLSCAVRCN